MYTKKWGWVMVRRWLTTATLVAAMLWISLLSSVAVAAADVEKMDTPQGAASAFTAFPNNIDEKGSLLKAYSINEINRYLSQMEPADAINTLKIFRVMHLLKTKYVGDVTTGAMLTGALKGTVAALDDPYSVYMDPKMYKDLLVSTKGSFSGVGLVLGMKEKALTVVAPIEGTPGEKAGIKSGDQIIRIDNRETQDMPLDEAVNMIRGPEGTSVTLTIRRGTVALQEFNLIRTNIQIKTVGGKMLDNGIGYIRLTMFNEHTDAELTAKLQELSGLGMKGLVLDLRNNPGGLLEASVKVARAFRSQRSGGFGS